MEPARRLRRLPPGVRADLLRVLTSPPNVRADVIRQFHDRGDDEMVGLLVELEAGEAIRLRFVEILRSLE
jgi:hypothetical protein